jgi:alkylation response protein AidB-like acyl-CoA dehydrogenase
MAEKRMIKGGEFLVRETNSNDIFIPEEFNEEQMMMAQSCKEFVDKEVIPVINQLDKHDRELLVKLMRAAGSLGLHSLSLPEEYGGFGLNYLSSMRVNEEMGNAFSFVVAYSAHTGIGTMPILYYGNEELKKKYLEKLGTGEFIGAIVLLSQVRVPMPIQQNQKLCLAPTESITS